MSNFRWHLSSVFCFFFLTNYRLERRLYVKLKDWMSNSVDPNETAHWAVSSGSTLFAKAYYYRLWQWKSVRDQQQKLMPNASTVYATFEKIKTDHRPRVCLCWRREGRDESQQWKRSVPSRHTTLKQRRFNVNVESTLFQRCVPAGIASDTCA